MHFDLNLAAIGALSCFESKSALQTFSYMYKTILTELSYKSVYFDRSGRNQINHASRRMRTESVLHYNQFELNVTLVKLILPSMFTIIITQYLFIAPKYLSILFYLSTTRISMQYHPRSQHHS